MQIHPIKQAILTKAIANFRPKRSANGPEKMQPIGVASEAILAVNKYIY